MKAMILAAGLGTRLKPWTLEHPKALVPVCGVPMLQRVLAHLGRQGFDDLTINTHHFADQIDDYLNTKGLGASIKVSRENKLLDTGGGLLNARRFLSQQPGPFLVHNVDILSDADLAGLMCAHQESGADVTLLCSDRESSRRLGYDRDMNLVSWHNLSTGERRIAGRGGEECGLLAFSGIYAMSETVFAEMERLFGEAPFPVMDFFLHKDNRLQTKILATNELRLIDIGKPDTLARAEALLRALSTQ